MRVERAKIREICVIRAIRDSCDFAVANLKKSFKKDSRVYIRWIFVGFMF